MGEMTIGEGPARAAMPALLDDDARYLAVRSRDARFDGWFFVAVTSTGIYCRPSCPSPPARPTRVCFFPTAAAAQRAGFRACKRCRPDATPGSPEWDRRADAVGTRDASHRRRRRRPGRRAGTGPSARIQRETSQQVARRRGRGGPAGPRPGPACPDGADPARDDRSPCRRDRLRGRLLERAPIQRDDQGGLRRRPDGAQGALDR